MRFKRPGVRYSESPEPETPYQRAGQVWDERLGTSRSQARNWRIMAFGSLGLSVLMGSGLLWQAGHSSITPYVVEVDKQGDVRAVGAAAESYKPSDAQIANHLARFMNDVRSLPLDPIVVRQNWLEAYDYATDRGAAVLNEYGRVNDPFGKVGKQSVAVEIVSVVRASPGSFQLRWIERRYENGALAATDRWTAILSIVLQPPGNEAQPSRYGYVNATQVWPYAAGALYQVYASPGKVTDVALQEGEQLVSVSAGDTVRWVIGDTSSGTGATARVHILVKPTRPDLRTNIVVNTDRRTYLLELTATELTWMASVSWDYPQDRLLALQNQNRRAEAAATEDDTAAGANTAATNPARPASTRRKPVRAPFPAHLPRERVVIPGPASCPCCQGKLAKLGEDVTETLEVIPRQFKVIQTVRERFA